MKPRKHHASLVENKQFPNRASLLRFCWRGWTLTFRRGSFNLEANHRPSVEFGKELNSDLSGILSSRVLHRDSDNPRESKF